MRGIHRYLSAFLMAAVLSAIATLSCVRFGYAADDWGDRGVDPCITICYVDDNGNNLAMDSVIVNNYYRYTPPTHLYIRTDYGMRSYVLAEENPSLNANKVLEIDPSDYDDNAQINIIYVPAPEDDERVWTVILKDGSVKSSDPQRVIRRIEYRGLPGTSVTHQTEQSIMVGDTCYVPGVASRESYEHTFSADDMDAEQVIYYVPDNWVTPEAYDVTVNYVNIATNEVLESQTYTASPSMQDDLEISSPDSFSRDGIEWVRLAGQEEPIRHSFYASERAYTVYYRDINDDLHADISVKTVAATFSNGEGGKVTRSVMFIGDRAIDTTIGDLVVVIPTSPVPDETDTDPETDRSADNDRENATADTNASGNNMSAGSNAGSGTRPKAGSTEGVVVQTPVSSEPLPQTGDDAIRLSAVFLLAAASVISSALIRSR